MSLNWKFIILLLGLWVLLIHHYDVCAQRLGTSFLGKWKYEIKETPFGEFSGLITFESDDQGQLSGKIVNHHGTAFFIKPIRVKTNRFVFYSNFENSDTTFFCNLYADSLTAFIEVKGDTFLYVLSAKRIEGTQ